MTHLQPIYRPDYGKDDCDFIHLEGEFEFRADLTHDEVYETMFERAEMIGGLCRKAGDNVLQIHPWNGPGSFLLRFPANDEPLEQIDVVDSDGEIVDEYPIEQMIERGKAAEVGLEILNEHMEEADESTDDGDRFRIDFGEGELVPVEEDAEE